MKDKVVAVVGGAGFVGRNVVRELCKKGVRVNVGAAIVGEVFAFYGRRRAS